MAAPALDRHAIRNRLNVISTAAALVDLLVEKEGSTRAAARIHQIMATIRTEVVRCDALLLPTPTADAGGRPEPVTRDQA